MFDESELITNYRNLWLNAEALALKCVNDIELPVCGFLSQLTSKECLSLIKQQLEDWSYINQPSHEKILLIYFISDYICCGLSSPIFHTEFHKTLQSNKSKIKLVKKLIRVWDCLFRSYKITSLNVEFIKYFIVCLEHLFVKISNSFSDDCIKQYCNNVLCKIKYYIKHYEQNSIDGQVFHTITNNMEVFNSNKKRVLDIANTTPNKSKVNPSTQSLIQQTQQTRKDAENMECIALNNKPKENTEIFDSIKKCNSKSSIDHQFSKKLLLNRQDAIVKSADNSDLESKLTPVPEQKLNAFQIMMLNAKKHGKTKVK